MSALTVKMIEKLLRTGLPGMTSAGNGLYLKIGATGGGSWIFRYKIAGKSRDMGLGKCPGVSLATATSKAADARKLTAAGQDPLSVRDAERQEQKRNDAKRVTFEKLATDYRDAHGASWSDKWHKGWMRKLDLYAFPRIGKKPADEISTELVLKVLQPIWATKTRTADEVRGQIEQILDAAKALGIREGENPARWRGHLDNLLSKAEKKKARKREHFPAMAWQSVPALMARLRDDGTHTATAAQLLILTGARAHMVRFAEWAEFDLDAGIWSLPGERMKMGLAFDVPLSAEGVALLRNLPRISASPFLFPGQGKTGVMHANSIRTLLHGMGHTDITRHGFRSSFRDWASERTNHTRQLCELALAHDDRDQTEGAYSRSDLFEKRRLLMSDWALYATSAPSKVLQGAFGKLA